MDAGTACRELEAIHAPLLPARKGLLLGRALCSHCSPESCNIAPYRTPGLSKYLQAGAHAAGWSILVRSESELRPCLGLGARSSSPHSNRVPTTDHYSRTSASALERLFLRLSSACDERGSFVCDVYNCNNVDKMSFKMCVRKIHQQQHNNISSVDNNLIKNNKTCDVCAPHNFICTMALPTAD